MVMQSQKGNGNPFPEKFTIVYKAKNATGGELVGQEPYHSEDDARKGLNEHMRSLPKGYAIVTAGIYPPFGEGLYISLRPTGARA